MSDPEKQEPKANVRTIVKASLFAALAAGLTSVIYFVARENPKSFPTLIPAESQPVPAEQPVREAPQPKT